MNLEDCVASLEKQLAQTLKDKDELQKRVDELELEIRKYRPFFEFPDPLGKELSELRNVAKSASNISEKQMYEIAELRKENEELKRLAKINALDEVCKYNLSLRELLREAERKLGELNK